MKAAIYTRVSTQIQADDGFSISAQLNLLNDYCNKNNIQVYNTYTDEGISGTKEERPAFQQMIKDATSKKFDMILVHKFDRFARNVELSKKVKRQLRQAGVNVISITEPIEDSPIGFITEGLMELLAEYYSKNLSVEVKKGHIERAKQGFHNGSVPYGYMIDNTHPAKMVPNPEQAKIVKLIYDMYINQGMGCSSISKELNKQHLYAAAGPQWYFYTVNKILKNPKYTGYIVYGDLTVKGRHEPIISEEDFKTVQRLMVQRTWKREPRGANFKKFIFLGLLRCGVCKRIMGIHTDSRRTKTYSGYTYVCCNSKQRAQTKFVCSHKKYYNVRNLETLIINQITENISLDIVIDYKQTRPIIDLSKERIVRLNKEVERSKEAYLAGVFSLSEYQEIKAKNENEIVELNKIEITNKDQTKYKQKINTYLEQYKNVSYAPEKRAILQKFIEVIYVSPERIQINYIDN